MSEITRVGADLAKRVIQVHAVNASGQRVTSRALPREKFLAWCAQLPAGCLVAMEASSSAHHWARKLIAMGLDARIIAAHLVAPYRLQGKSGKNDTNDAAAICEAACRPQMRFIPVKSVEQQSMLCIHRLREGFKVERIACINRLRGLLAEFGLVFAQRPEVLRQALPDAIEDASNDLGTLARFALQRAWTPQSNGAPPSGSYLGPHRLRACATRPSVDVQSVPRFVATASSRHLPEIPSSRKTCRAMTS
jgi:transposase